MWIAGREGTAAPPLPRMARLIGTDLPAAEYSTFGGEGTGVKFRNATAYKNEVDRTIQALRLEVTEDGLNTYYGYFYDDSERCWKLYTSAQAPPKRAIAKNNPNFGTLRGTGSFCEIPGPPTRERSGDVVREIKRRGWFFGSDQKWYRAMMGDALKDSPKTDEVEEHGSPSSKKAYYMDDYATEGWMAMATGGMELYTTNPQHKPQDVKDKLAALPEYILLRRKRRNCLNSPFSLVFPERRMFLPIRPPSNTISSKRGQTRKPFCTTEP